MSDNDESEIDLFWLVVIVIGLSRMFGGGDDKEKSTPELEPVVVEQVVETSKPQPKPEPVVLAAPTTNDIIIISEPEERIGNLTTDDLMNKYFHKKEK